MPSPAKSSPAPSSAAAADPAQLRNRAALLAFAAAFTIILALVALPTLVAGSSAWARVAGLAAIAAAVAVTTAAWRARVRLGSAPPEA